MAKLKNKQKLWRRLPGLAFLLAAAAGAQPLVDVLAPASSGGVAAVDRALAKLSGHRRLLVMAAHPDDEDTTLLALVARGLGGEAAYLSLNRGEGGQNLIGPELGVGLGLIRSGELLSARRIDGARQFFTRAFDFGYTRSLEETFERWPRQVLLEDAVRVVRRFRPQVIVSVFPPTAAAGHGQHQAAGVLAGEVFTAAGDPGVGSTAQFPWQPQAFYRAGWFDRDSPALEVPVGLIDPLDGRSVIQLALASRSLHRSQDMGRLQELGSRDNRLIPVAGAATAGGDDPFAGIDTRLAALAAVLPGGSVRQGIEERLGRVETLAREIRRQLNPSRLTEATGPLSEILGLLEECQGLLGPATAGSAENAAAELIAEKAEVARVALLAAGGLVADAYTDRGDLVPGESFRLTAVLWNSSPEEVTVAAVTPRLPQGWSAEPAGEGAADEEGAPWPRTLGAGETLTWELAVHVPPSAPPSAPYFLELPLEGDLYDWSGVPEQVRGEPFGPPVLGVVFDIGLGGRRVVLERPAVHRWADQARGEIRSPVRVVPALEVAATPELLVWPADWREARTIAVHLANHRSQQVAGRLQVIPPVGWPPVPERGFVLAPGGRAALEVALEPPPFLSRGEHRFRVQAVAGGETFDRALPLVRYEHVEPRPWPSRAEVLVRSGELRLPRLERVGYVRGASDRVPEELRRIGVPVEELDGEDLAVGDLRRFPVILVGSRAYETDSALAQANGRLLDYVRGGGCLIVQYQQYQFVGGDFAPFPLEIERPHARVTDEKAPVTLLQPEHRVFHHPNGLTAEDWQGWVQERGLYFPGSWDEAYRPLLAMSDPGQPEQRGALLLAQLGEGTYVYTGLAFFRQLPAGVLGGFRLLLNLLALGEPAGGDG